MSPLGRVAALALLDLGLLALGALLARPRRWVAAAPVLGLLAAPFLAGGAPPLARAALGLFALLGVVRTTDLVRRRDALPLRDRLVHAASYVDSRRITRVAPSVDPRRAAWLAASLALSIAAHAALFLAVPGLTGAARWIARTGALLVAVYATTDVVYVAMDLAYRAAGRRAPPIHDHPALARTVGEFWSRRWNRIVGQWLADVVFGPVTRRLSARAGVVATFAVSALIHAYLAHAALCDWTMTAWMACFFLAQGAIVLVESALGIGRLRPALGRAWTITALVATSPLFLEPAGRAIGAPP